MQGVYVPEGVVEQTFYPIAMRSFAVKPDILRTRVLCDSFECTTMFEVCAGVVWFSALPVPHCKIFCCTACALSSMHEDLMNQA